MTAKQKQKKQKRFIKSKKTINFKKINFIIAALVVLSGIYYLIGVNDFSIKAFVLSEQRGKLSQLKGQNNELELKVMHLSSYNNLSKKIENLKMVKVDKIDYISGASAVAVNK